MKVYIASVVGAGDLEFYGSMVFHSMEEAKREAVQALREYKYCNPFAISDNIHWSPNEDFDVWRGLGVQTYVGGYYIIIREVDFV